MESISIQETATNASNEAFVSWLFEKQTDLRNAFERFCFGEKVREVAPAAHITPVTRFDHFSGYDYALADGAIGRIRFAPMLYGGFVLHKSFDDGNARKDVYETFSEEGVLQDVHSTFPYSILFVDLTNMEPKCPILSHLYNYACFQYGQAKQASARTKQTHFVESYLRGLNKRKGALSVQAGTRDLALLGIWAAILDGEKDPVLTWEERQRVIDHFYSIRAKITTTKARVHRLRWLTYRFPIFLADLRNFFSRLGQRPSSNIKGISYRYTIGVLLWFVKVVRGNIGISIAMAIYGPFTFYFITQPMNPHAMWAVGRVRAHYLESVQQVKTAFGMESAIKATQASATDKSPAPASAPAGSPPPPPAAPITDNAGKYAKFKPAHLGILLSTDVPGVDGQSWSDRMSNFKDMQIAYEENMVFAARMGRLDQMETQLNFSMIVDSTWQELERYLDQIETIKTQPNLTKDLLDYLAHEETRAKRMQLYVWDKLLRYMLDHPFIVMDWSKEQVYKDYYTGHALLLFRDLTAKLAKMHGEFKKPSEAKKLEKLAAAFQKARVEDESFLERLKKNSGLFGQHNPGDGRELRGYMQRQWEVLYLLQNKAQEAANFGLQAYTWSVRNAVWILQSIYSAKRTELSLLAAPQGFNKAVFESKVRHSIDPLYESMFYMLNLEFTSLRPELSERLANDIEFLQRQEVINTLEESLKEREQLLKVMNGK